MTDQLLALAEAYSEASGLALSTIASKVRNDGKFFARIRAGGAVSTRNFEQAIDWFSANWPDDTPWPADIIARPGDPPSRPAGEPGTDSRRCGTPYSSQRQALA